MHTYHLKTFGCQMNKHDSEKIAGMLQEQGMVSVSDPREADAIVFMTCCVRENADERLYGQVASLKAVKSSGTAAEDKRKVIAVGGCIGQRDGEELVKRIPHIDVVFGTHNVSHLPTLLAEAYHQGARQIEILDDSVDEFAADLPSAPESSFHAWLPITVGCDNFCSYCVVPYVRGREKSRPFETIVSQAEELVRSGVKEITLLGQNVNSYGRDLYGEPQFARLLEQIAATGLSRLGFATSHPKDLCDETIEVMASSANILDYLHLPLQAGSTRILDLMNRRYTKEDYLTLVGKIRAAMPDIALTTDIIVGFPSESEDDFIETLDVVKKAGFSGAFTFLYSPREGTPAATMDDQIPKEVAQERFDRLVELIQEQAYAFSKGLVGNRASVLIEGTSKRDTGVLTGRERHYKTVHLDVPTGTDADSWIGKEVEVDIVHAHTWYVSGELCDDDG
jgi:tRNA-2-methylthio-N6-dimethylallyladenosine synthase